METSDVAVDVPVGQVRMALDVVNDGEAQVRISFSEPTVAVAMSAEDAKSLAVALYAAAAVVEITPKITVN